METLNNWSEKLPTNSKQGQNSTKKQQASVENPSYCLTNTSVEIRMAQAILDDDQLEIDSLLRQSQASKKTKISILLNTVSVQSLQAMFEEGKHATGEREREPNVAWKIEIQELLWARGRNEMSCLPRQHGAFHVKDSSSKSHIFSPSKMQSVDLIIAFSTLFILLPSNFENTTFWCVY